MYRCKNEFFNLNFVGMYIQRTALFVSALFNFAKSITVISDENVTITKTSNLKILLSFSV